MLQSKERALSTTWDYRLYLLANFSLCSIFSLALINQFGRPQLSNKMGYAGMVLMMFFFLLAFYAKTVADGNVNKVKKQKNDYANKIQRDEKQIKNHDSEIERLESQITELSSKKQSLISKISIKPSPSIRALDDDEENSSLQKETSEIIRIKEEINALTDEVDERQKKKNELERQKTDCEEEKQVLDKDLKKMSITSYNGYLYAKLFLLLGMAYIYLPDFNSIASLRNAVTIISGILIFCAIDKIIKTIKEIKTDETSSSDETNSRYNMQVPRHKIIDVVFFLAEITGTIGLWLNVGKVSHFNNGSLMMKIFSSIAIFGAAGMLFKTLYNAYQEDVTLKNLSPCC
jgi:cell division protein FtsL